MTKGKDKNSYGSILKGTTIFGGVQIFQMSVNLIRGKFVAMFLGPEGMGINSLFNAASQTIQQFAGVGLSLSLVKEVATHKQEDSLSEILVTAKRLFLIAAIVGALFCVVFARSLSRLTFGTDDFRWQFMLLGAMVFFGLTGQFYFSALQGLHAVKRITISTITGSLVGLLIGVPLYFLFGNDGIVPAMVALTFSTLIASGIGFKKALNTPSARFQLHKHRPLIKRLLLMGIVLISATLFGTACTYLINLFIRTFGQLENVGLYQAANSITNQYADVIFTAMMLDFFPRLTESAGDNDKVKTIVNRQLEIISLIASPLICLLILSAPLVVSILLTESFSSVVPLMRLLGAGVLIKALMFPLGYIAFAKDNKKLFFWMEAVFCNLLTLTLNCLGFYFFGLIGLGYSLIVDCALCFLLYYVVNRRLYAYGLSRLASLEGIIAILLGFSCLACSYIAETALSYSLMGIITAFALGRSFIMIKGKLTT